MRERQRQGAQAGRTSLWGGKEGNTLKPIKAQLVIYTGESENETVVFSSSKSRRRPRMFLPKSEKCANFRAEKKPKRAEKILRNQPTREEEKLLDSRLDGSSDARNCAECRQ